MSKENIIKQLDDLLANKNSRGFLNHLVKAYLPVNNVDKVFIKPKGSFKCSLSKSSLISVNEVLEGMQTDEYKDNFMKYLHNMMNPEVEVETPVSTLLGGRMLAVQGTKTDTFMALPIYHIFQEWIINKTLTGDKHINWLMRSNSPFEKKKGKKFKKEPVVKEVRATYSLGDLSELQKLKEKLKGN